VEATVPRYRYLSVRNRGAYEVQHLNFPRFGRSARQADMKWLKISFVLKRETREC
jgi:hypothetical protein